MLKTDFQQTFLIFFLYICLIFKPFGQAASHTQPYSQIINHIILLPTKKLIQLSSSSLKVHYTFLLNDINSMSVLQKIQKRFLKITQKPPTLTTIILVYFFQVLFHTKHFKGIVVQTPKHVPKFTWELLVSSHFPLKIYCVFHIIWSL